MQGGKTLKSALPAATLVPVYFSSFPWWFSSSPTFWPWSPQATYGTHPLSHGLNLEILTLPLEHLLEARCSRMSMGFKVRQHRYESWYPMCMWKLHACQTLTSKTAVKIIFKTLTILVYSGCKWLLFSLLPELGFPQWSTSMTEKSSDNLISRGSLISHHFLSHKTKANA